MIKISYQQICAYLEGKCNAKDLGHIEDLRREDPAIALLVELIDELKGHADSIKPWHPGDLHTTVEIDTALESLLSGNAGLQNAQALIRELLQSSSFYERFARKVARIVETDNGKVARNLRQVRIREDGELLEIVKSASARPKKKKVAILAKHLSPALSEFWAKLRGLIRLRPTFSRRKAGLAMILVVIVAIFLWQQGDKHEHQFTYYYFGNRVPYEYDGPVWRGSTSLSDEARLNSIQSQFMGAISDYMLRDYQSAISQFENLQSAIASVQSQTPDRSTLAFVRDYYFYFGLSHFAYANSAGLNNTEKKSRLDRAIRSISQADQIGKYINPAETDRENYFLGVVFTFASRSDSALTRLRAIKQKSVFYQDSIALIKQLAAN